MQHAPYHVVLSKIGGLVATVPNPAMLFQKTCEYVVNHTESTGSYFAMIGRSPQEITILASAGIPDSFLHGLKVSVDPDHPGSNGLVGRVYRAATPVIATDSQNDPRFEELHELLRISNIRSGAGIPLFVESRCRGVLVLVSEEIGHYSAVLIKLLEQMAEILAVGIDRAEQREHRARYQTLYTIQSEVNKLVARIPEPKELYEETCRIVAKTSGILWADVHVPDSTSEYLWLVASSGPGQDAALIAQRKQNPLSTRASDISGQGIAGTTFRAGKTTLWANVPTKQEFELRATLRRQTATRSLLGVPVLVDGACQALLVFASREADFFDNELVGISEQVAESLALAVNAHAQRVQMQQMAQTDPLTGLSNRLLFSQHLIATMERVDRERGRLIIALLNLDGFHEINTRLGRQVGDALLCAVASRLTSIKDNVNVLARLDGDEFAVMLFMDNENSTGPDAIVTALFSTFDDPFRVGSEEAAMKASVGTSVYPDHGPMPEDLMRRADLALQHAKSTGGGVHRPFTQYLEDEFSKRSRLKSQLRDAIEQGEIIFYYQPVVELPGGRIVGAEALARWQHPQEGLLSPEHWITIVEENPSLISALGRHALSAALHQLNVWHSTGNHLWLAVNIGVHHLLAERFFGDLRDALSHAPHLASHLVIEVTETALIDDFKKVASILMECRMLGVHIALDDFGTGQASLMYLQELPADHLKIDRVFVSQMLSNLRALGIVRASVQVTRMLDMDAIAEGVESEVHGLHLMRLGYRYAQGFAVAAPMSAPVFGEWQSRWRAPSTWAVDDVPLLDSGQTQILACLVRHRERFQKIIDALKNSADTSSFTSHWGQGCAIDACTADYAHRAVYDKLVQVDKQVHELEMQCMRPGIQDSNPKQGFVKQLKKHLDTYEKSVSALLGHRPI